MPQGIRELSDGLELPCVYGDLSCAQGGWVSDEARGLVYLKTLYRRPGAAVTLVGGADASAR